LWCCVQVDLNVCPNCNGVGYEDGYEEWPPLDAMGDCYYCGGGGWVLNEDVPADWYQEWLKGKEDESSTQ